MFCSSCMHFETVKAINKSTEKIALQEFYSPCCGWCGQRIVIETNGKQYALLINCQIEDQYSSDCMPYGLGTQKHVLIYKRKKVRQEEFYKAVYDTAELKKIYPKANKLEWDDEKYAGEPLIPLTPVDSLLIEKYYALTAKKDCSDRYLKAIKGFIRIKLNTNGSIDNKKVKIKTSP